MQVPCYLDTKRVKIHAIVRKYSAGTRKASSMSRGPAGGRRWVRGLLADAEEGGDEQ